jgi:hypothetical protein
MGNLHTVTIQVCSLTLVEVSPKALDLQEKYSGYKMRISLFSRIFVHPLQSLDYFSTKSPSLSTHYFLLCVT